MFVFHNNHNLLRQIKNLNWINVFYWSLVLVVNLLIYVTTKRFPKTPKPPTAGIQNESYAQSSASQRHNQTIYLSHSMIWHLPASSRRLCSTVYGTRYDTTKLDSHRQEICVGLQQSWRLFGRRTHKAPFQGIV